MQNKVSNTIKKKTHSSTVLRKMRVSFIIREVFTINVICKIILLCRCVVYYNVPNIDLRKLIPRWPRPMLNVNCIFLHNKMYKKL